MAPNIRVAKAFRAMKMIGIPEEKTKPVLKKLLKDYEKNWDIIELENYRVLADAIFDAEEAEAAEKKKRDAIAEAADQKKKLELMKAIEEEAQIPEEPERPLKRLRLRHRDGTPLIKPKLEIDDLPYAIPKSQARAIIAAGEPVLPQPEVTNESVSDSGLRLRHMEDKGKEPISPQTDNKKLRSISGRSSHGVQFKDTKPKVTALPLIKPKDEPVTDDTLPLSAPLSVSRPESLTNGHSSTENNLPGEANKDFNSNVPALSNEKSGNELATIQDKSTTALDIASSSSGEIKISLICNSIKAPNFNNVDALLKKVEDKCLKSYKFLDSNFSVKKLMKDICDSLLETEPEPEPKSDSTAPTEPLEKGTADVSTNGSVEPHIDKNGFQDPEPQSSMVVPNNQLTADDTRSVHDINDITKGQESVIVSLVNEVNTECPPLFHYISNNAVFQNAYVNFSLARIGDDDCCSGCSGNCLTSTTCGCIPCSGGEFAYTKEGLVKEKLLDEFIKMNRDPQEHRLFYCKECPLERSKNTEIVEACKGHSDRGFIKECWLKCGCNKQCGNRVVQRGIQRKLQVFMTPDGKGWGLRTLEDLPKGAFVCEYVGEVLTTTELYDRVSKSSNKDEHAYPVLLDADWAAQSGLKDEESLCLDSTYYGNVARFVNHRCFDSNMVEIPVEVENPDHNYYHLAFFTTRKVNALEELTWDYGIDFDDEEHQVKAFTCKCGSRFCRNIKPK